MTLKFEVKLSTTWPFITRLVVMMQSWSWCLFWHFWGQGSQKNWNKSRDLDSWPSKSRSSWVFNDLLHFRLYTWYRLDLHVDFKVFDARDLAVITIFHLTSTDDLDHQGQNYLLWPLAHHGLDTWFRLNLGVDLNISNFGNLKMTNICHMTSIVDLENQGQT